MNSDFVQSIQSRTIPFLVAEIGVNHEGSLEKAKELVGLAHSSGADAVKFQTFSPELYVSTDDKQRFERVSRFCLKREDFVELKQFCDELGTVFFSTPLAPSDVEFLNPLVPFFKVSSGDLTNYQLLESVALQGKPVIISTGFGDYAEIEKSIHVFKRNTSSQNRSQFAIMHTVPKYPTPPNEANLRNILGLRSRFNCLVGYSDHTIGIEAALVAHVLGAKIIEKHFTDRKSDRVFRDHSLSAEASDFLELRKRLEDQHQMLGNEEREISAEESKSALEFRRSLAISSDLKKGHRLDSSDLVLLRPGNGIAPEATPFIIGRSLNQDKIRGSLLKFDDLI